jgi:hypothetical protein
MFGTGPKSGRGHPKEHSKLHIATTNWSITGYCGFVPHKPITATLRGRCPHQLIEAATVIARFATIRIVELE